MKPALFISYSRRQTPFVDYLAERLRRNGHSLWLDYRSLVPAKPWFEQILTGIKESDALLLVVSKDSIASRNVAPEWQQALELEKRIVLLIFEAVPLPAELQDREWVDFRGQFAKSVQQLEKYLAQPANTPKSPPPISGFTAPLQFWLALILSIIVLFGSIPLWWTLFVPLILVPMPRQIYKRNYVLSRVAGLLLTLPVLLLATSTLLPLEEGRLVDSLNSFLDAWIVPTTLASWMLLVMLFSPSLQRRALPEAAVPRYADPHIIAAPGPRTVKFLIDYAPEDAPCAEEFRRVLEREGHEFVRPGEKAEAIFVLLSTYKKSTEYNPDYQAVFPVLLQTVQDVDPKLQRVQWIDFGQGIRNIHILAKLLPEPEKLLRAFAMPPIGSREFFPVSVNGLQYFFVIMALFVGGHFWVSLFSAGVFSSHEDFILGPLARYFAAFVNLIFLFTVVLYALKGLRSRRGGTSTIYPLFFLTIFLTVIVYFTLLGSFFNSELGIAIEVLRSDGILIVLSLCPVILLVGPVVFLIRWRTLRYRWLPRHHNGPVDRLESALLLYTPAHRNMLVLHITFHTILLLGYILFMLAYTGVLSWSAFGGLIPTLLIVLWGIHRLARISK